MRTAAVLTLTLALTLGACSGEPAPTGTTAEAPDDTGVHDGGDTEATAGGSLTFVGTDDVAWAETNASTAPGTTEITIECGESVNHGVAIEGVQGGAELAACDGGGTGSATVELEEGDHTFFCTVPGHREQGMEGRLTVE